MSTNIKKYILCFSMMNDDAKVEDFYNHYYINTVTRSPAFIVGMIFGYLLHLWKQHQTRITEVYNCFFSWALDV